MSKKKNKTYSRDVIKGIDLLLNSANKLGRHNTTSFSNVQGSKTDYNRRKEKKVIQNIRKYGYED